MPDDGALALELATAARPHLSRIEADRIYIAIGVGDTFAAIAALLAVIARSHVPLGRDLLTAIASWLDCHRGHDTEPRLRTSSLRSHTRHCHRCRRPSKDSARARR